MRTYMSAITLAVALVMMGTPAISSAEEGPAGKIGGFYVGGHVGGAFGDARWSDTVGNTWGQLNRNLDPDGLIGGGQAGYMFQFNNLVVGADVSYSAGAVEDRITAIPGTTFDTRLEHITLVQGRLGWVIDQWLLFAQGGYAGARGIATGSFGVSTLTISQNWHDGWTVGGGVSYKFDELFMLGVEYNYVDLGSENYSATVAAPDFQSVDHEAHIVKFTASLNLNEFFARGKP